jgi:hypothetical protein
MNDNPKKQVVGITMNNNPKKQVAGMRPIGAICAEVMGIPREYLVALSGITTSKEARAYLPIPKSSTMSQATSTSTVRETEKLVDKAMKSGGSDDGSINRKRSSNSVYLARMAQRARKAESLHHSSVLDELAEHVATMPPSIKPTAEERNTLSRPLSAKKDSKSVAGGSVVIDLTRD